MARLWLRTRRGTSETIVRALILLLLLLLVPSTSVRAQLDPRVRTGARVRVSTAQPEPRLAIGKVTSIDADTIVVDRGTADSLRLAVNDITALEVYRRGKRAERTGMVFGTISAAGGAVAYLNWCLQHVTLCEYLESDGDTDDTDDEEESDPFSMLTIVAFSFGALGYALGYALVPPRWEIVNLPVRIGVAPMQRGVGVYVQLPAPRFAGRGR